MKTISKYSPLTQEERLDLLKNQLKNCWIDFVENGEFPKAIRAKKVDPNLYALYMYETYHYTYHNARNQALVGVRAKGVNPNYVKFCFEHAEEETGHELMALHDVRSMGYDVSENNIKAPLPQTEVLVAYLYWISAFGNPLQRLGYSFWAESVYEHIDSLLGKIKSDLNLQNSQMTFFVAHSSIDEDHAAEVQKVMLANLKTEKDWEDVEQVMLTSLDLTFKVTDAVLEEFDTLQK